MFCTHLREALKVQLNLGKMKTVKGFAKTCYSEILIPLSGKEGAEGENEDGSLLTDTGEADGQPLVETPYQGGLGLTFKFPGDAKKRVGLSLYQTQNSNAVL
jgi:TBC1 domain family member 8/9